LELSEAPDLQSSVSRLTVSADQFPLPELGPHRLALGRALDIDDVAIIAVANNPDLKATRASLGVAEAQAFAAGILPNPQVSLEHGFLFGGPGTVDSMLAGVSQEIVPLLTLSSRKAGAQANAVSVELSVVWAEWQVVSRARLLFVDAIAQRQQRNIIAQTVKLLRDRYKLTSDAMKRGDQTLPTVTSDLVALNAAETQLYELDQLILKNKHDLDALLGLLPEVQLALNEAVRLPAIDARQVSAGLRDLAGRRPDMLALRAGYEVQDEKVRQAIIEQFPKLSVGTNFASDTSGIQTQSIALTFSLPIFDRNQGNIAIQRATRVQLHEEYQARLDAAFGAAARILSELHLTEDQYRASIASRAQLRDAVKEAEPAFRAGNLDERTFLDFRSSLLAREIATVKLWQSIMQQRVALQTLLGSHLPSLAQYLPEFP
jgi:outer membrane protein TolC